MIELFDADRLLPKHDHSLVIGALLLAFGAGGLSVYAGSLQSRLRLLESQRVAMDGELRQQSAKTAPSAALVADLQHQVQRLEADVAAANGGLRGDGLAASQWLDRLGALATPEVSLNKIDLDRNGSARIEGQATSPQAVSGFVQAFSERDKHSAVRARSIEVRQDKSSTAPLRFQMRANLPSTLPADVSTAMAKP